MTKIKIKNFQSIKDVEFDVSGFTVVIGKNNAGKSAMIRAVDAALNNKTGQNYIRRGTKGAEVSLEAEGLSLIWKKGESSSYNINKEPYSKLNRNVPEPILSAGFRKMEVGDKKLNPLYADQFNPLFLVHESGSFITEALSIIYKLNILSDADDKCQKDLRAKKSLQKTRNQDLEDVAEKVEKFKGIEEIKSSMKSLEKMQDGCTKKGSDIELIMGFQEKLSLFEGKINVLALVGEIKVPSCSQYEDKVRAFEWVEKKNQELFETATTVKAIRGISGIEIPESASVEGKIKDMNLISGWEKVLSQSISSINSKTEALKQLEQTDDLGKKCSSLSDITEKLTSATMYHESLHRVASSIRDLQSQLEKIDAEILSSDKELSEMKIAMKVCAMCAKPF